VKTCSRDRPRPPSAIGQKSFVARTYESRGRPASSSPRTSSAPPREYTFAVSMKLIPSSNAASTQATASASEIPAPKVSHDPREISDT
jgi:hypothetical protein